MCVLSINVEKSGNLFNDPRINHCKLFNAKSSLYIYILNI